MSMMDIARTRAALKQTPVPLTFAGATGVTNALEIEDLYARGLAVEVPVGWSAANIGLDVSREGTLWTGLYDQNGARVQITTVSTTVRRVYITPPEAWGIMRYRFVRLASLDTSTGAAVAQTLTVQVSVLA